MKLGQIKGNQPDLVEPIYCTLPPFRKLLLIADNATDLEIPGNTIRRNTEVVDNDGLRIVHDPKPTLAQTECKVPILTITRRKSLIESAKFSECCGLDEQARARAIHHFAHIVISRQIGIV